MIIAVLSNSGNVGKTTITRELLANNLSGHTRVVEVEENCTGNSAFEQSFDDYLCFSSDDFSDIYTSIIEADGETNLILDIGSSSIMPFFENLREYSGISNFIDLFVIPTTREAKQLRDTINTAILIKKTFSVDGSKIILLPNRANEKTLQKDFMPLYGSAKAYQFNTGLKFAIPEISILKDLELAKKTISETSKDETDYMKLIKATKGESEQKKWIKMDLARRKSVKICEHLAKVAHSIIRVAENNALRIVSEEARVATDLNYGEDIKHFSEEVKREEELTNIDNYDEEFSDFPDPELDFREDEVDEDERDTTL